MAKMPMITQQATETPNAIAKMVYKKRKMKMNLFVVLLLNQMN